MAKIFFHYVNGVKLNYKAKGALKKRILFLFENEGKQLKQIDYVFCDDEYLLNLNQSFLNHNTLTDIITFNLSESKTEIIGEVYISLPRVLENAKLFNQPKETELERIVFHGALHLCGYKDKTKPQSTLMRKMENTYLNK